MSVDTREYLGAVRVKAGSGSQILPYIQYKNHVKAMERVQANLDTGRLSPEKSSQLNSRKIRHELTQIMEKKKK